MKKSQSKRMRSKSFRFTRNYLVTKVMIYSSINDLENALISQLSDLNSVHLRGGGEVSAKFLSFDELL